jgi:hypothetical protein
LRGSREVKTRSFVLLVVVALLAVGTNITLSRVVAGVATDTLDQRTEEITEANWQRHPKITAIRNIVRSVNAGLRKGTYKTARREFESCPNQYFTLRRIARDAKGVVAWYEEYFEYEDGSYDFHAYYDHAGRLRFVLVFARAANGTREQLRIYFDETGKRLWKIDKLLKGWGCPGCFSSYTDSDEGLAFDPAKEFKNDTGCKEIKPKRRVRT